MSAGQSLSRIRFWLMEQERWLLVLVATALIVIAVAGLLNYREQRGLRGAIVENRIRTSDVQRLTDRFETALKAHAAFEQRLDALERYTRIYASRN